MKVDLNELGELLARDRREVGGLRHPWFDEEPDDEAVAHYETRRRMLLQLFAIAAMTISVTSTVVSLVLLLAYG